MWTRVIVFVVARISYAIIEPLLKGKIMLENIESFVKYVAEDIRATGLKAFIERVKSEIRDDFSR